jgi:hypothetical protein
LIPRQPDRLAAQVATPGSMIGANTMTNPTSRDALCAWISDANEVLQEVEPPSSRDPVRPSTGKPNFAWNLQLVVDAVRGPCDECLIIETSPFYVQCLFNRDQIFGEVVSNTYLKGGDRLLPAQELRLLELGWLPPHEPCHSQCRRPHPNFSRVWSQEVPSDTIVHDLLEGLMIVAARAGEGGPPFAIVRAPRRSKVSTTSPTSH